MRVCVSLISLLVLLPGTALAGSGYHPFAPRRDGVRTVDLSAQGRARAGASYRTAAYPDAPSFHELDALADPSVASPAPPSEGSVVVPSPVADGVRVDPEVVRAVEDIPGNEYPRKHTLYLNFTGGMLYNGGDNSAESRSSLAQHGEYPAFTGGEAKAIAAAQEVANDVSQLGIRVVYEQRPPKILPYTMVMVGGSWTDTNLEDSAAGVAPGTDCGALGQRHVVYTFAAAGWSATAIANVSDQEAGHAWGLDHSLNCNSVMSYCGSGNGIFSPTCDPLCEGPCSSPAGCRLFHEDFCGVGSDRQNEMEELSFLFGGNEPDLEPPTVEIVSPADDDVLPAGSDVDLRAVVDDNYGGYAWRFLIELDGEVVYDQIDYDREVDPEYRAALNLVSLDPGTYVITIEIADHFDHLVSDTVSFVVESAAGESGGGVDETGGGEGPGGTGAEGGADTQGAIDDSSGGGEGSGSGGTDPSAVGGDEGCACRAQGGGSGRGGTLWGLLGLLALGRRISRDHRGSSRSRRRAGTRTSRVHPKA
ncbi:MAG: hypothetical protein KC501_24510 [Myxococcales bacterium]|nr:hypothetical protein [Myxococcales bacterium]